VTNNQNAETIENAYHAHDISKLETKSKIAVADYVEITEKQKEMKIIAKYDLFSEIEEI
jgi:hypothetical protein